MAVNRIVIAAALAACTVPASAANISWGVHIGVWSAPANWNGGVVPTAGDNVFVTDTTRLEQVTIDVAASINALTLSDFGLTQIADSITLENNRSLTINGGGFLNDGHFVMQSAGNLTTLSFVGAQTVAGRGVLEMSDNPANRIITNNEVLQHGNGFGHEIRGAGRLLDNTGGLWNRSTIRQQGANALVIDPNGLGVDNDGLLVAEGSGGLSLVNGTFDNATGEIRAGDQSKLVVNGATISGGTLSSVGNGVLQVAASTLDGVANLGTIEQANNTQVTIKNGLLHNGTWSVNSTGNLTMLFFNGTQSVSGNGSIVMSDNSANRLINNNTVTTIGTGITVRGAGRILDNTGGLDNQGTLLAEGDTALVIDPNGQGFVQNGVLRAVGAGGLQLINGVFDLTNPVEVQAGSALLVTGATLNAGTLDIAGGVVADIRATTLDGMTINGAVNQVDNQTNTIVNGLTVNGSWTLASVGNLTSLSFNGAQSVSGNGSIVMSDNGDNRLFNNNTVTTIGAGITVRGAGRILDNTGGLDNQGTLLAEGDTALVIDPNGQGFVQNGVLRAAGTGGLQLINGVFDLTNPVEVQAGSALLVTGATLNAGTLDIAGGVVADIRATTLDGMTIDGAVNQVNNQANTIVNGLTVNGSWTLTSGGSLTSLFFNGAQSVSGNGSIVMSDNGANRLINNNTVTTIGTGITVRGAGHILNNTGGMINVGTLVADVTNPLVIDPNGLGFENRGLVQALGAGGIKSVDDYHQTAGATVVESVFDITNRTLIVDGGTLSGSGTIIGDVANNAGVVGPGSSPGTLTIDGDFTQGGTGDLLIEIAGLADFDVLSITGTATLGGDLEVQLLGGYVPLVGQTFDVLLAHDIIGVFATGQFVDAGLAVFELIYLDDASGDIVRLQTVSAVPLPAGIWLLLSALVGLAACRTQAASTTAVG